MCNIMYNPLDTDEANEEANEERQKQKVHFLIWREEKK